MSQYRTPPDKKQITLQNKVFDGGEATDSSMIILPKNTTANLAELMSQEAQLAYDTDQQKVVVDKGDGNGFQPVSSGGGGGSPGGSNGDVQFNDSGEFSGQSALNYNNTDSTLNIAGTFRAINHTTPSSGKGLEYTYDPTFGTNTGYFQSYDRDGHGYTNLNINASTLRINNDSGGDLFLGAAQLKFPATDGTANQVLKTDGAGHLSFANAGGSGTVTSVDMTVPSFLSVSGNPITTSGTLAVSLSGTALPILNGGTGQTTANAAFNALAPSQTSNSGKFLTTDGTNASWVTVSGAASSGSAGDVQFSDGSGGFSSATNVNQNILFWNSTSGHLGVGTNTTGFKVDIKAHSNQLFRMIDTDNNVKVSFQTTADDGGTMFWVDETGGTLPFSIAQGAGDGSLKIRSSEISIAHPLNLNSHVINNVTDPTSAQQAATKNYVDNKVTGASGTFTTADSKTVTVVNGLITSIV